MALLSYFAGRPEISITGRISIVPTRAAGICPAIAIASSINQQHVFHCLFGSPFSSSRARSTAGPGSKSSSSKNWRISISPSPLLWGAGACFAHSMASCLDFTWMIAISCDQFLRLGKRSVDDGRLAAREFYA